MSSSENLELNNLLNSNENANTKKTYKTSYNKLMKTGKFNDTSITNTDNLKLIEIINDISTNPNNRKTYLTTIIKLKRLADSNADILPLEHFRTQNKTDTLQFNKDKKSVTVSDGLTFQGFQEYVAQLLIREEYMKYIVNYLMLHFGVRNKDTDLVIVNSKSKNSITMDDNYLVVYKTKIEYIRNKYKTYNIYGQKKITITDKKFINAVNNLGRENLQPLLITSKGSRYTEKSLPEALKRLTYAKAGEGRLFKLLVDEYKFNKAKLNELSISRGTNLEEIKSSYTTADLTSNEL